MKQSIEIWEIWLALGLLLFGGFYLYTHVDFADLLEKDPAVPTHMEGKIANTHKLKNVKLVSIPDDVYQTMDLEPKGSKYLKGNKKYIVAVLPGNCPYAAAYKNTLNRLFKNDGFNAYYRKHLMNGGYITCRSENCSMFWLYNNCGGGVCLINPLKKQAVIDNSQDPKQLPFLLAKYKNW